MNTPLTVSRESILVPGGNAVTTYDYDDPNNPLDNPDIPNESPTEKMFKVINEGYTFDENGQVVLYKYVTSYTYKPNGQVLTINGPRAPVDGIDDITTYVYETGSNFLWQAQNPLGHTGQYEWYNHLGIPERSINQNGLETQSSYDNIGRLQVENIIDQETNKLLQTQYFYDGKGFLDYMILPGNIKIDYDYYAGGQLFGTLRYSTQDTPVSSQVFQYDRAGNRVREEVWNGAWWNGQLKRFADYLYNTKGQLEKVFNPNFSSHPESYDPDNPVFTQYFYDLTGNEETVFDYNNYKREKGYDNLDRITRITNYLIDAQNPPPGLQLRTDLQYDRNGNIIQIKQPNNISTDYLYDDLGRIVQINSPDTGITRFWYDSASNMIGKIDANGKKLTYTYDILNRVKTVTDSTQSQNPVTLATYYYDGENPHNITVNNGIGRLTGISDASGMVTYSFDKWGNTVLEKRTIAGQIYDINYSFNDINQLSSITYPDGRIVEYIYSPDDPYSISEVRTTINGNQITVASNIQYEPQGDIKRLTFGNNANLNIQRDWNYDITGIQVSGTGRDIINNSYTRDNSREVTAITDALDANRTENFGLDSLYRIITAQSGSYGALLWLYDLSGNRTQHTKPNKTIDYFYNPGTNQLSQFTDPMEKNVDKNKLRQDYKDLINDLRHIIEDEWDRNCTSKAPKKACWVYVSFMNRINAVINESGVDPAAFLGLFIGNTIIQDNLRQLLDRVNARTPIALIEDEDARLYRNIIDEMNQVVVHSPDLKPKDPTLVYDNNGNIIEESMSGTKLIYDSLGRLIRVADINDSTIAEYTYDATNKRVSKTAFGITTVFVYDIFGNLIGEYTTGGNLIRDYIYLGSKPIALISHPEGIHIGPIGCPSVCTISGGRLTTGSAVNGLLYFSPFLFLLFWKVFRREKYSTLYAIGLTAGIMVIMIIIVKESMAQTQQESIYYYHTDHLGRPIMLTDSNQAIAWDATYEPFGKATLTTASITNNLRFPGQYYDAETGLHYNMARYYWPDVGRYIQPDPLGLSGYYTMGENSITQYNIYTYALNDPINKTDATGLWTNPTGGEIRGCDPCCYPVDCGECGSYGACRDGCYRRHPGVDIIGKKLALRAITHKDSRGRGHIVAKYKPYPYKWGDAPRPSLGTMPVFAVIRGVAEYDNGGVKICDLQNKKGWCVRELHILPFINLPTTVSEGQYLGIILSPAVYANEEICKKEMTPHVHVEAYKYPGGRYNPEPIADGNEPVPSTW